MSEFVYTQIERTDGVVAHGLEAGTEGSLEKDVADCCQHSQPEEPVEPSVMSLRPQNHVLPVV